jgi:hypothetical protein
LIDRGCQLFHADSYSSFLNELELCWPGLINQPGFIADLEKFVHTVPKLPSSDKNFTWSKTDCSHLNILPGQSRKEILDALQSLRQKTTNSNNSPSVVDLAFYAGRFMDFCDWKPFFKAAFERNPVSLTHFEGKEMSGIYNELISWPSESIYDANRLALPDEVVNFKRGDGIEMAITIANVAKSRHLQVAFEQDGLQVTVLAGDEQFVFSTSKNLMLPDLRTLA